MSGRKVGIVAECVCDLPKSMLEDLDIQIVYFLIKTERGIFTDTNEITADNIWEYMQESGKCSVSCAPSPEVYQDIFTQSLKEHDEVILVAISSGISESCDNAGKAVCNMGKDGEKVHIFDSGHLSTGLGHLVIKAAQMAAEGESAAKILYELGELKNRISTTFVVDSVDYLYRNKKISEQMKKICNRLHLHPVLVMKNGVLTLKSVLFGDYEKAGVRYLARELKYPDKIDRKRLFLTHAGCSIKKIERLKEEITKRCQMEELIVTEASAAVSSNCGPNTFGVLFVKTKADKTRKSRSRSGERMK